MNQGDAVRLLAVLTTNERLKTHFLQEHESWGAGPFQLVRENRPTNWLLRKSKAFWISLAVSSPACGEYWERTSLFKKSKDAIDTVGRRTDKGKENDDDCWKFNDGLRLRCLCGSVTLPYGIIRSWMCQDLPARLGNGIRSRFRRKILFDRSELDHELSSHHTKSGCWKTGRSRLKRSKFFIPRYLKRQ